MQHRWWIVPLLILVLAEGLARLEMGPHFWYEVAQSRAQKYPVELLVLGSSMAHAAVDPEALGAAFGDKTTETLATGGATLAAHYLGLRNLLALNPDALRQTMVLIEAPDGVAQRQHWADSWSPEAVSYNLTSQLQPEDLKRFLFSATSAETKARVLATFPLRSLRAVLFRKELQLKVFRKLDVLGIAAGRKLGILGPATETGAADLVAAAGIQNEAEAVAAVRKWVQDTYDPSHQPENFSWPGSVLDDLVHLVQAAGGRPVVFHVPVCKYRFVAPNDPARADLRAAFRSHLRHLQVPFVDTDLVTTEADFPDLIHLRHSLSEAFSQHLAQALLALN